MKGKNNPIFNKKLSKKTRRKISIALGGDGKLDRKNDYSSEFNYKLRNKIRKRDNYTCQKCSLIEKKQLLKLNRKLSIHHINYNKKNNKDSNLITLCHNCHIKTNTNRKYWIKYFINKQNKSNIIVGKDLEVISGNGNEFLIVGDNNE